ncbi:hypothetical protein [Nonlabens xiamenensis]|uniref:hypothetical protein n=1 Tax=Nonlabens xiamenensis TaxID=2341043 RepID=UPI000F615C5E|nr:hypothetical protein [Nonlabens xiamenensis]
MISIATDPRQLILIYNSVQKNHREIHAYAVSADKNLLAIDVSKDKVAGTVWTEIADLLQVRVRDLIHTDHAIFEEKYGKNHDVDCDGAIKILQHEPDMLIFPYLIRGGQAKETRLYSDVLEFFDNDTAEVRIP